jgi:hypothetical protein
MSFLVEKNILQLEMMYSTSRCSWNIIKTIVENHSFFPSVTVATLALGSRPRERGCKVVGQEEARELSQEEARELSQEEARELSQGVKPGGSSGVKARGSPGVTSHTPGSVRKCEGVWGSEHSHSHGNSHFRRWSPGGLSKLQRVIAGVKPQCLVAFFISLESSWNVNV